jgi:hypothetical protein
MKTLKKYTLLYDDKCPLCVAYTSAFVNNGMLDENGRTTYGRGLEAFPTVDENRARNEIALVNTKTGEVIYGLESILKILSFNSRLIKILGKNRILNVLLNKLYKFISFNRKVIAPSKDYLSQKCVPDLNVKYRMAFILFTAVFTSLILYKYSFLLSGLIPESNLLREFGICFGQLIFQSLLLFASRCDKRTLLDYLGNMMTISFIGGLLLLPALIVGTFFTSSYFFLAYFFLVVLYMFFLHVRRVKWIGAPAWLSATWVAYRSLILIFIL